MKSGHESPSGSCPWLFWFKTIAEKLVKLVRNLHLDFSETQAHISKLQVLNLLSKIPQCELIYFLLVATLKARTYYYLLLNT